MLPFSRGDGRNSYGFRTDSGFLLRSNPSPQTPPRMAAAQYTYVIAADGPWFVWRRGRNGAGEKGNRCYDSASFHF
jgi:hypothetical protein